MSDLLKMMLHLADLASDEAKTAARAGRGLRPRLVTAADVEKQEWDAFKARLAARDRLLGIGPVRFANVDVEEDDIDVLLSVIGALERTKAFGAPALTVAEIVRAMQNDQVLSLEFVAAARAQAVRLLSKLREMNRVYADTHGRWALL